MDKLLELYKKHKEIVNYLIVGGLTTVVSLATYYGLTFTVLDPKKSVQLQVANIISWIAAVVFAYFTNRKFVFESKSKGAEMGKEATKFALARVGTLLMDMAIMALGVSVLHFNDKIVKLFVQVVVTVANYVLSKLLVFRKSKKEKAKGIKFDIVLFFIIAASAWGLFLSIMIPVSQTPDEYTHFDSMMKAYGTEVYITETLGNYYTESEMATFNETEENVVDTRAYFDAGMKPFEHKLSISDFKPTVAALRYLPAGVGFYLGALLHLPRLICFQLAELMSLAFYVLLGIFTLKRAPVKKEIFLFVLLMPMAMQQAGSINPDVVVNACSFLLTAMILDFKISDKTIGWKDMIIVALLCGEIFIAKQIYVLLAAGIFMVPIDKFSLPIGKKFDLAKFIKKRKIICIIAMVICIAAAGYVMRNGEYFQILTASVLQPGRTLLLIKFTALSLKDYYLQTLVGCFGYLDSFMSYTYIVIFFMMLMYIMLFDYKEELDNIHKLSVANRIFMILIAGSIFILVFMSQINWSFRLAELDMNGGVEYFRQCLYKIDIILGVQGRYFIPALPMLIIPLTSGHEIKSKKVYNIAQICFYAFTVLLVCKTIIGRYWR